MPIVRPPPPSPYLEAALVAQRATLAAPLQTRAPTDPLPYTVGRPRFTLKVYPVISRDFVPSDNYLVLDVVPRSKAGVLVQNVLEASFTLSCAKICEYKGKETKEPWVNLKYDYGDWGDKSWNDGTKVQLRPANQT
jgi:hypothetical protein